MTLSPSRVHTLGIGLVCAAGAAIALVGPASGPAGASAPDTKDHFGVLAKAPTGGDGAFFASPSAQTLASMNPDTTPDPQAARSRLADIVGGAGAKREISITSGSNGRVCLGYRASSDVSSPILITCAPIDSATEHGLVSISHPAPGPDVTSGGTDVTALVPDGVSEVQFVLNNGNRRSASVRDNTVTAHLKDPASMSFDAGTGAQHVGLGGM